MPTGSTTYVGSGIHLTTEVSQQVAVAGQVLHTVCVNTTASSSTVTLYDNTSSSSGGSIAVINSASLGCYTYDITLTQGLYVVVAGGTPDVTISVKAQP